MRWEPPRATEIRLGMEITLYNWLPKTLGVLTGEWKPAHSGALTVFRH
jgi:coenzyme PQQ precursor peptide PqqA